MVGKRVQNGKQSSTSIYPRDCILSRLTFIGEHHGELFTRENRRCREICEVKLMPVEDCVFCNLIISFSRVKNLGSKPVNVPGEELLAAHPHSLRSRDAAMQLENIFTSRALDFLK